MFGKYTSPHASVQTEKPNRKRDIIHSSWMQAWENCSRCTCISYRADASSTDWCSHVSAVLYLWYLLYLCLVFHACWRVFELEDCEFQLASLIHWCSVHERLKLNLRLFIANRLGMKVSSELSSSFVLTLTISAPFSPPHPTSARKCCHTYELFGMTNALQILSNLPSAANRTHKSSSRTHLTDCTLMTSPQTPTKVPLITCFSPPPPPFFGP